MQKNLFLRASGTFIQRYWLALLIMLICGMFQWFDLKSVLEFNRTSIIEGEHWRWLSANFIHLGTGHYWMNMGALGLLWLMFYNSLCWREWIFMFIFGSLVVSVGVWFFDPHLTYYVGLSGTLHGVIIAGALRELPRDRLFACAVLLMAIGKLIYEQLYGALPGSESTAGGHVLVNAHLYGALGGALSLAMLWLTHSASRTIKVLFNTK